MKRSRESLIEPLGATEFAATLNGEDPNAIYRCLKRFVRIVRRERMQALRADTDLDSSQDEASNNSEDDDVDEEVAAQKRLKKGDDETWKDDSANYNVPFVGTSVTARDVGTVVVGEWPTGLLKAYLAKSPLAVELTGDELVPGVGRLQKALAKNKKGRLSRAIYKVYLQALGEVVTAAIPMQSLIRESHSESQIMVVDSVEGDPSKAASRDRIVAELIKKRLPGLLASLRDESDGKNGVSGRESLTPLILHVLARLSMITVETCRQICRSMQSTIPERIVRILFRPTCGKKANEKNDTKAALSQPSVLASAINLARVCLEWEDPAIFSCVALSGARERKIPAGMVFLALKELTLDAKNADDNKSDMVLYKSVAEFLGVLQRLLSGGRIAKRLLGELLSRDAVQNICRLTAHAPVMLNFQSTVSNSDVYTSLSDLQRVGVEARRVMLLLLADTQRSPLLHNLQSDKSSANVQLSVRAMVMLMQAQKGLEVQKFIVDAVAKTPELLVGLFHALSIPDSKRVFDYIKSINFVSRMIRDGPSTAECVDKGPQGNTELVVDSLLPTGLRKPQITKALLQSNALVVAETLKFLVVVLERLRAFVGSKNIVDQSAALKAVASHLPEFHTLLSLLQRFTIADGEPSTVVVSHACSVIRLFASLYPQNLRSLTLDWAKVLSTDKLGDLSTQAILAQLKVISTLLDLYGERNISTSVSIATLRIILTTMIATRSSAVFGKARILSLQLLLRIGAPATVMSPDCQSDIKYELSCWVDGLSLRCLDDFCSLLYTLQESQLGNIQFAKAWKSVTGSSAAEPNVSSLLLNSFSLPDVSESFSLLCCQVASRCLLHHLKPLPLAAFVMAGSHSNLKSRGSLQDYARCLSSFSTTSASHRNMCFVRLMANLWSPASISTGRDVEVGGFILTSRTINSDIEVMLRQSGHQVLANIEMPNELTSPRAAFRLLYPAYLKVGGVGFLKLAMAAYPDALTADLVFQTGGIYNMDNGGAVPAWHASRFFSEVDTANITMTPLFMHAVARYATPSSLVGMAAKCLTEFSATSKTPIVNAVWLHLVIELLELISAKSALVDAPQELFANAAVNVWLTCNDKNVLHRIENVFFMSLLSSTPSSVSCALLSRLAKLDSRLILKRCVANVRRYDKHEAIFILALIKSDAVLYGATLLKLIASDSDICLDLYSRLLDGPLCEIVKHSFARTHSVALDTIRTTMARRVVSLINSTHRIDEGEFNELTSILLAATTKDCELCPEHYDAIAGALIYRFSEGMQSPEEMLGRDQTRLNSVLLFGFQVHNLVHRWQSVKASDLSRSLFQQFVTFLGTHLVKQTINADLVSEIHSAISEFVKMVRISRFEEWLLAESACSGLVSVVEVTVSLSFSVGAMSLLHDASEVAQELMFLRDQRLSQKIPNVLNVCRPELRRIFLSVSRHSIFRKLLTDTGSVPLQSSMLKILSVCTSSLDSVDFDYEVMGIFLQAFGAGVTVPDRCLRNIIYRYNGLADMDEAVSMDQLRWNEAPADDGLARGWDWLPDAIDIQRMYATLRSFPTHDKYLSDDSITRDQSLCGSELDDRRYSPAFVLPLVLASLIKTGGDAVFAHNLCEKGGLALALASLCSTCSSVRQLAAAILGQFLTIMYSEAARALASWRDRPQIAMLLKSVHQSLAIKRVEDNWKSGDIIKLPGVSAIFLAKASMILARPNDKLFAAMNRFFLRVDDEHGAFQDLDRLPAFISLFCSTANEPGQASAERSWALRLVADGFMDEDCYKPVVSCYALELVITSIESSRIYSSSDQESVLALHALRKIICVGGERCEAHVFKRLGLLYWAQSMLVSRPWIQIFPSVQSRKAFVDFLYVAVQRAAKVLPAEDMADASLGLAPPLVPFCLVNYQTKLQETNEVVLRGCEIFRLLRSACEGAHGNIVRSTVQGISLSSACHLLDAVVPIGADDLDVLHSICTLPMMCFEASDAIGVDFCDRSIGILNLAQGRSRLDHGLTQVVLNRLRAIIAGADVSRKRAETLIAAIFNLRMMCSTDTNTKEAYLGVVRAIRAKCDFSGPWRSIADQALLS
ncbi:hypothetical protein MPSEU_000508700 [Mayamaea pseudoterrestris]|nr:hypothetical protein MPSEU_000508700 [Mayamaea pseudoterrestris]